MATAAEREANLAKTKSIINLTVEPNAELDAGSDVDSKLESRIFMIDSHVHLYPASEAHTLAWMNDDTPQVLKDQHSPDDYVYATNMMGTQDRDLWLEGFIHIESDRICDLASGATDGSGWEHPLAEVDWLRRICVGEPRDGEGHSMAHVALCKGIVPWAPIPFGPEVLARYVRRVITVAGDAFEKIKGFRYLVQDKPDGTMLEENFIQGLRWLGEHGYVFDVGVDYHRRGGIQLAECAEMIQRVHAGVSVENQTVFVLNHFCKPDLSPRGIDGHEQAASTEFKGWNEGIYTLARTSPSKVYMKLSGLFSELPSEMHDAEPIEQFRHMIPWLASVLIQFRRRLMFGSDWPICTVGVGERSGAPQALQGQENEGAWEKWRAIVERLTDFANFTKEEKVMLWSVATWKSDIDQLLAKGI